MTYKTGIKINKCVIKFMFLFFRRLFTGFTGKKEKKEYHTCQWRIRLGRGSYVQSAGLGKLGA